MKIIFWISLITILYTYIGYPILVYLLSFFYKKPLGGKYIYPTISIIIAAYNEEKNIENKIRSLRELDYPEERMEVLIGSDGSTDRTDEIVKSNIVSSFQPSVFSRQLVDKIKFFRQDVRQGKPSMLQLLVAQATGEILVLTDARQALDKNVLKELVKHFGDTKVGSVSAALFYTNDQDDNKTEAGVGLYWGYEKFIRKSESRMGSMLGATGALYAIRRELFPQLPRDLLLDDVYIPMKIVEKGYRAIFDSKAKVYDRVFKSPQDEFLRRTRTLAGNYQLFLYLRELFNPLKGKISWQFFSHKFLRLVIPFFLMSFFVSNFFISDNYFYSVLFIAQIIFYALALLGVVLKKKGAFFDVPYMFCVMNGAALVGLYKFLAHKQDVTWRKAQ